MFEYAALPCGYSSKTDTRRQGMGFARAPRLSGHAFGVRTICPQERQAGTCVSSPCGDRSIKGGFSLPPHRRKKRIREPGGLCRSLPPANAPGLNPYIVEFGHSTTHRGGIAGTWVPRTPFRSPSKIFLQFESAVFRCERLF